MLTDQVGGDIGLRLLYCSQLYWQTATCCGLPVCRSRAGALISVRHCTHPQVLGGLLSRLAPQLPLLAKLTDNVALADLLLGYWAYVGAGEAQGREFCRWAADDPMISLAYYFVFGGSIRIVKHLTSQVEQVPSHHLLTSLDLDRIQRYRSSARPEFYESGPLSITAGRHPVLETVPGCCYASNDTCLSAAASLHIVTGPNMSGKSTYLKQVSGEADGTSKMHSYIKRSYLTLVEPCPSTVPCLHGSASDVPILNDFASQTRH